MNSLVRCACRLAQRHLHIPPTKPRMRRPQNFFSGRSAKNLLRPGSAHSTSEAGSVGSDVSAGSSQAGSFRSSQAGSFRFFVLSRPPFRRCICRGVSVGLDDMAHGVQGGGVAWHLAAPDCPCRCACGVCADVYVDTGFGAWGLNRSARPSEEITDFSNGQFISSAPGVQWQRDRDT